MQIDPSVLSEKNYTGSRLIEIKNDKINELQTVLNGYQQEINPLLDKLSKEYYPTIDPLYRQVGEMTNKLNEIKSQIAEITATFQPDIDVIEAAEQKAKNVQNKMQPIIQKELEGKLGEFEIARHTKVVDGKIYAEVFDEIEEKIKAIRANKRK